MNGNCLGTKWSWKGAKPRVRPTSCVVIVALVPFSAVNRKLLLRVPDETDDDDWGDTDDEEGDQRNGADGYQLLPQNLDPPPANERHGTVKYLRIFGRIA